MTGSVYPQPAKEFERSPAATPRVVFRNLGNGRFEQTGPAVGDLDILIVNLNAPPSLPRNDLQRGGGHSARQCAGSHRGREGNYGAGTLAPQRLMPAGPGAARMAISGAGRWFSERMTASVIQQPLHGAPSCRARMNT